MRILLTHANYGSAAPSGENRVFELERDMLLSRGHVVETFERHNDTIRTAGKKGLIIGALSTPWNAMAAQEMRAKIASFRPDVVHVHNTFPLLSPAIFPAARGAARVLTLHNYRLQCAAGIPMREGRPCTDCIVSQSVLPALKHGCYRDSRIATVPLALNIALHRHCGTWQHEVERFIALSAFQKDLMAQGGLPLDRIDVKPNFYPGRPNIIPFHQRPMQVIFVGRISAEKGVSELLDAWRLWGVDAPNLKIVGEGPLRAELEARSANMPNVHFTGQLKNADTIAEIARSRLLLVPSLWFEAFPMILPEAFSCRVAVGVSRIGPLPELAKQVQGLVFAPGDVTDIHRCVSTAWAQQDRLRQRGDLAFEMLKKNFSESANYDQLIKIYDRAIAAASRDSA